LPLYPISIFKPFRSSIAKVVKRVSTEPLIRKDTRKIVISWTGEKDGCYACYNAMAEVYQFTHLLNFRNLGKTGSHEINPETIQAQPESIGIPLVQRDFFSYEQEFKKIVSELRAQGGARIDGAVFRHFETHKWLVDRICRDLKTDLSLSLWQRDSKKIISDIIDAEFEVIIVSARAGLMGREWLG